MTKPTAAQSSHTRQEKKERAEEKKFKATTDEVLQELFHDMYNDCKRIYKVYFFGGLFFGIGTFFGVTVVVALVIWFLTQFVDIPGIGEFFERLLRVLEQTPPPTN